MDRKRIGRRCLHDYHVFDRMSYRIPTAQGEEEKLSSKEKLLARDKTGDQKMCSKYRKFAREKIRNFVQATGHFAYSGAGILHLRDGQTDSFAEIFFVKKLGIFLLQRITA